MRFMGVRFDRGEVIDIIRRFSTRVARQQRMAVRLPEPYDPSFPIASTGIDSLLIAELVMDLETHFKVELPFSRLSSTRTIGEFVDVICEGGT